MGDCTTYVTLNFDGYYFENNDDVLIDNWGETYANPYVMLDDNTKISFQLYTRSQIIKENRYHSGGIYELSLVVRSMSPIKSIKTVTFNRVTIQAGDNEFNMIEMVNKITTVFEGKDNKLIFKRISEGEIDMVHSSGQINAEAYRKKIDDLPDDTITGLVLISFNKIPIDYTIYNEILIKFDITVEYTTGETVRLDKEFYGLYEIRRTKQYRTIFTS